MKENGEVTDINIGDMKNSIEEDIKIVENYLANSAMNEIDSNFFKNGGWETVDLEIPKSMQHILSDYKRVLKENEELKLKEKRRIIGKYGEIEIHDLINRTLSNDYISVKKIKDKIEELNRRIEIYRKYVKQGVETDVEWVDNVADRETVKVLQELIEESGEK